MQSQIAPSAVSVNGVASSRLHNEVQTKERSDE